MATAPRPRSTPGFAAEALSLGVTVFNRSGARPSRACFLCSGVARRACRRDRRVGVCAGGLGIDVENAPNAMTAGCAAE